MSSTVIIWGILIFVVCMLTYPIIQLIPSKRLKQKIKMREYATSLGLKVDVRSPEIEKKLDISYGDLVYTVGYRLEHHNKTCQKAHTALRTKDDKWLWINKTTPPGDLLMLMQAAYADLPKWIKAVEQSPIGTTLYWKETENIEDVDTVNEHLQRLDKLLNR